MNFLQDYMTFNSKHEMNEAVKQHIYKHKFDLTKSAEKVLSFVAAHSTKFAGASTLKAATIAEAVGLSDKTIRRALNLLSDLNIIKKLPMIRKVSGGFGANVFQILPFSENDQSQMSSRTSSENPCSSKDEGAKNKKEPFNFNNLNNNNIKERNTKEPSKSKLLNYVPKVFKETAAVLNTADRNIYELWNVVKQVNKKYNLDKETIRTLALEGFNILKGLLKDSYKEGKEQIKNMFGKFNRIMHNVISNYLAADQEEDQEENNAPKELPFYNWLEGEGKVKELSLTEKIDSYVPYIPHNEGDIECEMPY